MRILSSLLLAAGLLASTACDYTGEWLYAEPNPDFPAVVDLGELPIITADSTTAGETAVYGFIGATGDISRSGATFTFTGTGGDVCLVADPELMHWSQSVSEQNPNQRFAFPDNLYDDGDLDMTVGQTLFYSGTPGQEMGDFDVRYQDSLGNEVLLELNLCEQESRRGVLGSHSGRGMPEFCTIENTQPELSYTGVLSAWSLPIDDDVLSFGLLVLEGSCGEIYGDLNANPFALECLITGEMVDMDSGAWDGSTPLAYGSFEPVVSGFGVSSVDYEAAFCSRRATTLPGLCLDEAAALEETGQSWFEYCDLGGNRCFCGDETDTPSGGTF